MLQQTTVSAVIPYFEAFMERFPSIETLAQSPLEGVLAQWTGLGYYARARNIHKTAQLLHTQHHNQLPNTMTELTTLPGIGPSTAGAILSQAFSIPAVVLDANIKRVLLRFYGLLHLDPKKTSTHKGLWALAERNLPSPSKATPYTQALMDLGATLCTANKPLCTECPFVDACKSAYSPTFSTTHKRKIALPVPTKTKKLLIIIQKGTHILLEKRPPHGLWGGLWSFPEGEEQDPIPKIYLQNHPTHNIQRSGKHIFSHYTLHYIPILISHTQSFPAPPNSAWIPLSAVSSLGTHGLLKKIIQRVLETSNL
jgi:A/G-specific adenine glycosylase